MKLAPTIVARLVSAARQARLNAYAPYSRFRVGAAVLADDGRVFAGCNVENSSFGLTVCAERNAVAAAIAEGARPVAVAVVTESGEVAPCGACRQVLAEFSPSMPVLLAAPEGAAVRRVPMDELLPGAFVFPGGSP
jgi:cytidine deaminase